YGEHYFHCWIAEKGGAHGTLGLSDAIKVSCDSFFYQFGNAAGIDAIDQTGNALGLGKESGIHLTGEQPGIMPGPEWMAIHFSPEQIEMVRRGLWKVVNEDGGTGGRARLKGVEVAGKTGTAQASTNGKKDTIAWFCCFAPFDHPKYVVVAMVQGGEHGGSVAAPIATRILDRTLAMDAGTFEPQVAWLAPAHHANPFAMVKDITFKDTETNASADEEHGEDSQT